MSVAALDEAGGEQEPDRRTGKLRWRWYHAYLLLALLDLLTVSGSLFLTARLAQQSVEVFRARQEWTEIRDDLADLGRQTADVNLPGNEIFESGDVASESDRLREAIMAFQQQAKELRDKVSKQADRVAVSHLSDQLGDIVSSTLSMAFHPVSPPWLAVGLSGRAVGHDRSRVMSGFTGLAM